MREIIPKTKLAKLDRSFGLISEQNQSDSLKKEEQKYLF
jgi:hypothetical protein